MAEQGSAQSTGRWLGLTIPKAGRRDREGGRQETQDRASQQGQFGEALDAFEVVNELAMGTHHLFGAERDLLDGSTVGVNGTNAAVQVQRAWLIARAV